MSNSNLLTNKLVELSEIKRSNNHLYLSDDCVNQTNYMPDNWDNIPGARGCTPQSCSFRDNC